MLHLKDPLYLVADFIDVFAFWLQISGKHLAPHKADLMI